MNRKILLYAFLGILLIVGFIQILMNPNYETICVPADSSEKEKVVFNSVILHDFQVYPLLSDKKEGCLLLHDWYDKGSAKYRDGWKVFPFAQFVNDNYDHCCVTGQ